MWMCSNVSHATGFQSLELHMAAAPIHAPRSSPISYFNGFAMKFSYPSLTFIISSGFGLHSRGWFFLIRRKALHQPWTNPLVSLIQTQICSIHSWGCSSQLMVCRLISKKSPKSSKIPESLISKAAYFFTMFLLIKKSTVWMLWEAHLNGTPLASCRKKNGPCGVSPGLVWWTCPFPFELNSLFIS